MYKTLAMLLMGLTLMGCNLTSRESAPTTASTQTVAASPPPSATSASVLASRVDMSAPAAQQAAPTSSKQPMVGKFPTSLLPAKGTPWKVLHADSYKGDFDTTCRLLGLNKAECEKFSAMRDAGQCQRLSLPNGVVLDRLGYSRGGGHHVQHQALVALQKSDENPMVLLCDLGDKFVGFVERCGNPIRNDKPKSVPVAVAPVSVASVQRCPAYRTVTMHVWPDSLPKDIMDRANSLIQEASSRTEPKGPAFSNVLGGELRRRAGAGEFSREGTVTVETYLVDGKTGAQRLLSTTTVDRQFSFEIPAGEIEGNHLRQVVTGPTVVSPTKWRKVGQRELWTYWSEWGSECSMHNHVLVKKAVPTT